LATAVAIAMLGGVTSASAARPTGAPSNSAAPTIADGTPAEHKRVKGDRGSWSGATPLDYTYAWSRCNASGGECQTIQGAAKASYLPVADDVGHRLVLTVTAKNAEGSASASSAASALVAAAAPKRKGHPTIAGVALDGRVVTVGQGAWKGTPPFTYTYLWKRCRHGACAVIAGATGQSYRLQTADIGDRLKAFVTATNGAGSATTVSKSSAKILPGSPLNLVEPTISGIVLPGQVLTANEGSWVGTTPIDYAYQWLSCAPLGGGCSEISGATEKTYTVGISEIGDSFEVSVTASNAEGSASATSPETSITGGGVQPPVDVLAPTILGLTITGQTVSATMGVFTGTEPSYAYQWELCNSSGASCGEISGATESSYTIPAGEVGDTLRVVVTASNAAGSASATSEASTQILGLAPVNEKAPSISGSAVAGQLLSAASGEWTGTEPILYGYEWERCNASGGECKEIAGQILPLYAAGAEDVGHTLRVVVTASNVAGSTSADSEASAVVAGVAPSNAIAPLILGLTVTGQSVSATSGTWTGTEPIGYAYQWELCNSSGASCGEISGATESSYTIAPGDTGDTLRVVVTASNVAGSVAKTSEASTQILGQPPVNTEAPSISGTATAGQLLTASAGKWSGTEPILYGYEWERCNASGGECKEIAGQILPLYSAGAEDVGHTLRVVITASNIAGSAKATTAPSAVVGGVVPSNAIAPLILGLTVTGQSVSATSGTWTGTEPIGYAYQWELCNAKGEACKELAGATKSSYTIPSGEVGETLRVVVTASNVAGSVPKTSEASTAILGLVPVNTEAPSISGTTTAGQILTAASGKWTGTEPILYGYEWERCNSSGGECKEIAGQTLALYTATGEDVNHTLRVVVTASNVAGSEKATSAPSAGVAGVPPANVIAPLIVATPVSGIAAVATEGTWTGTEPITYAFQWKHCNSKGEACTEISGATKDTFTASAGEVGKTLRVVVTATNVAGSVAKESAQSLPILL
jgi:hypothetical protein